MHLTDPELLEPNESQTVHLVGCDECQLRSRNLLLFREQLGVVPLLENKKDSWDNILSGYVNNEQTVQIRQVKSQLRYWKYAGLSLAASLFFVLLILPMKESELSRLKIENQLAEIIEENNYLQQQLIRLNWTKKTSLRHVLLKLDIENLDQHIQTAYIDNINNVKKTGLWEERRLLMVKLLKYSKEINETQHMNKIRI